MKFKVIDEGGSTRARFAVEWDPKRPDVLIFEGTLHVHVGYGWEEGEGGFEVYKPASVLEPDKNTSIQMGQ